MNFILFILLIACSKPIPKPPEPKIEKNPCTKTFYAYEIKCPGDCPYNFYGDEQLDEKQRRFIESQGCKFLKSYEKKSNCSTTHVFDGTVFIKKCVNEKWVDDPGLPTLGGTAREDK